MLLENAFRYLKRAKLVSSHGEFSTDFLGRRPRYYDDLVCARREPSAAVVANLAMRLSDVARRLKRSPDASVDAAELEQMIASAFAELRKRFITVLSRNRPAMNKPAPLDW